MLVIYVESLVGDIQEPVLNLYGDSYFCETLITAIRLASYFFASKIRACSQLGGPEHAICNKIHMHVQYTLECICTVSKWYLLKKWTSGNGIKARLAHTYFPSSLLQ